MTKSPNTLVPVQATEAGFLDLLNKMKVRAQYLSGRAQDGRPLKLVITEALDATIKGQTSEEAKKVALSYLLRARQGDATAQQELAAMRVIQATNYMLASQNILSMFFNTIVLALDEAPFFINNTGYETKITYVAEDGTTNRQKLVRVQDSERIDLRILTTPLLRYKKTDLYQGNIIDNALQTLSLAYDMANQMESLGKTMLTSSAVLGTFLFTDAKKTRWPWVSNSRIKIINLPTTNDITLPDNGTGGGQSNKFRLSALKAAGQYVDKFAGAFSSGNLMLTGRVLVPGVDAVDLSSEFSATGDTSNPVADSMLVDGWRRITYDGHTWIIVPDNTLNPGACYFEMNMKGLNAFLKPALDKDAVRDDYATNLQNEIERYAQKVFGAYSNPAERARVLRVIYNDTFSTADP